MNILALDTSTPQGSIAWGTPSTLQDIFLPANLPHSQTLLPAMEQHAIDLQQCHALAFNQGPGAFTGLRHGAASVQAIALALNLPVFGISSLKVLAMPFFKENVPILSLLDARMNEIYAALLMPHSGGFHFLKEPFLLAVDHLPSDLPSQTIAIGNIQPAYPQFIQTLQSHHIAFFESTPSAKNVAQLAFLGDYTALSADAAQPIYVRNKVAQTLLERQQKG